MEDFLDLHAARHELHHGILTFNNSKYRGSRCMGLRSNACRSNPFHDGPLEQFWNRATNNKYLTLRFHIDKGRNSSDPDVQRRKEKGRVLTEWWTSGLQGFRGNVQKKGQYNQGSYQKFHRGDAHQIKPPFLLAATMFEKLSEVHLHPGHPIWLQPW